MFTHSKTTIKQISQRKKQPFLLYFFGSEKKMSVFFGKNKLLTYTHGNRTVGLQLSLEFKFFRRKQR